ncbi:hypothetical protein ACMFMF_006268 [Clarireedia jacksonii]
MMGVWTQRPECWMDLAQGFLISRPAIRIPHSPTLVIPRKAFGEEERAMGDGKSKENEPNCTALHCTGYSPPTHMSTFRALAMAQKPPQQGFLQHLIGFRHGTIFSLIRVMLTEHPRGLPISVSIHTHLTP